MSMLVVCDFLLLSHSPMDIGEGKHPRVRRFGHNLLIRGGLHASALTSPLLGFQINFKFYLGGLLVLEVIMAGTMSQIFYRS